MTDLRTAAQQALEALTVYDGTNGESKRKRVLAVLRAALVEDSMQKFTDVNQELEAALAEPVLNPAPGYCKHCKQYTIEEPLPAEPVQEPVAGNWSVFNTGAEVFSGMSLPEAVAELTPARLERGWSAVCVINKDNPPTYAATRRAIVRAAAEIGRTK